MADPASLTWRYYVKLDPAEIPKAMWAEVSPDGKLIWTSSGNDLLAYSAADVKQANAGPLGKPIKAVRRLAGAVPPSGITGATFFRGRLFLAGTEGDTKFEVWSVDPSDGSRRLEVERDIVGESEGLDTFDAAGGTLHWLIQPFNTIGTPTYEPNNASLLHFQPAARQPAARSKGPNARLTVKPRRVSAGRKARFRFTLKSGGKPVGGARVTLGGFRVRTNRRGRAMLTAKLRSPGTYAARATHRGMRDARATVRVIGKTKKAGTGAPARPRAL